MKNILRFKQMIDLNKVLTQRHSYIGSVVTDGCFPVDAQRHMLVVRINHVAQVFICDILLREWKIFCLVSYQKIACEIHLKNVRCKFVDGLDAKRRQICFQPPPEAFVIGNIFLSFIENASNVE